MTLPFFHRRENPEDLDTWLGLVSLMLDPNAPGPRDTFLKMGFELNAPWQMFLGKIDDEAVGTLGMVKGTHTVSIFSVTTLGKMKGNDIAKTMMMHIMRGVPANVKFIGLHSTAGAAEHLYLNLGLQQHFKVREYSRIKA